MLNPYIVDITNSFKYLAPPSKQLMKSRRGSTYPNSLITESLQITQGIEQNLIQQSKSNYSKNKTNNLKIKPTTILASARQIPARRHMKPGHNRA